MEWRADIRKKIRILKMVFFYSAVFAGEVNFLREIVLLVPKGG